MKYSATDAAHPDGCSLWNYRDGNMTFGTDNTERMRISKDGYVGFGVINPINLIQAAISHAAQSVANIKNTNSTGYGVYIGGGNTTQYALRVDNYAGTKRFEVLGDGKIYVPNITHVTDPASGYRPVYQNTSTGELINATFT